MIQQYGLYWIDLDPSVGAEMRKLRPCVVVSPNEMNAAMATVIVVPVTKTIKAYLPFRVNIANNSVIGSMALDHIRGVDKGRIKTKLGKLSVTDIGSLKSVITEILVD